MSSGFDKIINNLLQIIQEAGKNKTTPLDAQAEVRRVEGNTAWVHIAGGVDETPVRLTINARVGDKVQVRLSGGRAWITGNASAPPTDDHLANTATEAAKTADNYISADSTGIMVSENNGATKETPSNATKNNVLITEKDVQIRNGQKTVASYGDTTIIGTEDGNHIVISDDSIRAKNGDAESLKISLTPDRPTADYAVDFDGSTIAQRVQNSETITIICQLREDAISVFRAFLMHESISGTDLIIDNSKNWIKYVLNTNSVTITIDGSDTEAKAVQ